MCSHGKFQVGFQLELGAFSKDGGMQSPFLAGGTFYIGCAGLDPAYQLLILKHYLTK